MFALDQSIIFPSADYADGSGLLAVGGDLSVERLLAAYRGGIFPWYGPGLPILWYSPDPRGVLRPQDLKVSKSLAKSLRKMNFRITTDSDFSAVIQACARAIRPGQDGTWIVPDMIEAYEEMFEAGFAHSVEVWEGDTLVGGLYGISLGGAFFGESMFHTRTDASKVALVYLVEYLKSLHFDFIDCQQVTGHLERMGASAWSRAQFLEELNTTLDRPDHVGPWTYDPQLLTTVFG